MLLFPSDAAGDWREVYRESFDQIPAGTRTKSAALPQWEGGSALGNVFDGKTERVGKFLIAANGWTSFNQGPIFNLDLSAVPHDRVRVQFDLYAFGEWRGLQKKSGGPQHRLMFFDNKAKPAFAFDTNFATAPGFQQSWPGRNPAVNKGGTGGKLVRVDRTGRFGSSHRWSIQFEYPSESRALRFAILCGAAAGSGRPMPEFGIDNVRVSVRSTAPTIIPKDDPNEMRLAKHAPQELMGTQIPFELNAAGKVSLGIYDKATGRLVRTLLRGDRFSAGKHNLEWDGLDDRGQAVPQGSYEWRLVSWGGFTARYLTTIGINPPGGEHPVPSQSWVGDHLGAGLVDVDRTGVYIGSPLTEGGRMILKADSDMSRVLWRRPQFYQGGRLTRIAAYGNDVFMVHPNGKLRRLDKDSGRVEAEWQVSIEKTAPHDMDAHGKNLVVTYPSKNLVRWLSAEDGKTLAEFSLKGATAVTAIEGDANGEVFVSAGKSCYRVKPGQPIKDVATLTGEITAMDYDANRRELWIVVDGHQVVRLDSEGRIAQSYSDQPRGFGPFDPTRFAGVTDIAADRKGGFMIGEPGHPPRRIAHIARDGSLIGQWFGGMSFYVNSTFDPADPTRLIGIAPEGFVNVYRVDYENGTWEIEACYQTGRLGDSLFPHAGSFRAIRRDGELYLYHRVVPAVLKLDPIQKKAIPVAIAGRVINQGRTFFQFAGTGRDGFPKPWVQAAEHQGYQDLKKAPKLYSWADSDGDGEFDSEEFRFSRQSEHSLSFHNPGDFTEAGDYIGTNKTNAPTAVLRLPVSGWEGPKKSAPRWDWNRLEPQGKILADSFGYGSPRGVSVGPDGSIAVAYQAGLMIKEHGQFEGGGWPERALKGSRLLGFDASFKPKFVAGRQSKLPAEANTGVLYYPMQTSVGPRGSIVVNDQTRQPAQVWTHDGLYVGSFFDHQAEDGLDERFYQVHGDDNQGVTIIRLRNGRTFWLMPYQGHNRIYEISGWENWHRQSGEISPPDSVPQQPASGEGLTGRYYQGRKLILETTEAPIYHELFGKEPHSDQIKPHYKAVWAGLVIPPLTDDFTFQSLLGQEEQVAVWIDGRVVHTNGLKTQISRRVRLTAGHKHSIRIEYINPSGRAELKLLWASHVVDPQRLPVNNLFPR